MKLEVCTKSLCKFIYIWEKKKKDKTNEREKETETEGHRDRESVSFLVHKMTGRQVNACAKGSLLISPHPLPLTHIHTRECPKAAQTDNGQ